MIPPSFFVFSHQEKMMGESFADEVLSPVTGDECLVSGIPSGKTTGC
jgi:hypothetical protein